MWAVGHSLERGPTNPAKSGLMWQSGLQEDFQMNFDQFRLNFHICLITNVTEKLRIHVRQLITI